MSTTALSDGGRVTSLKANATLARVRKDPAYQAFWLLRIAFTVAPILFGADKFANFSSTGRSTSLPGSGTSVR
jgi:hypothetical protein